MKLIKKEGRLVSRLVVEIKPKRSAIKDKATQRAKKLARAQRRKAKLKPIGQTLQEFLENPPADPLWIYNNPFYRKPYGYADYVRPSWHRLVYGDGVNGDVTFVG